MIGLLLTLSSLSLTSQVAEKIWHNECGSKTEELTHWKKGEEFASVGIGHFIWYPAGKRDRFQETFPELLEFMENKGAILPAWLKSCRTCPWNSREEFYQNIQSPEMETLSRFLFETKSLQAEFIVNRLEKTLPSMVDTLPDAEKKRVRIVFDRLSETPAGLYALIDYLHFKGEGTLPSETYNGQGWGLLQVLFRLNPSSENLLVDFVREAKAVLSNRIQNSPPERNEEQWKKGWFNRIDNYLK
jgi:hypothetical protein